MKSSIVPARASLQWLGLAYQTYCRNPSAFLLLTLLYACSCLLANCIPFIGAPLSLALEPFAVLMAMAAAARVLAHRMPGPSPMDCAFSAVRTHLRAMLMLGAVQAIAFLLILALVSAIGDGSAIYRYLQAPLSLARSSHDPWSMHAKNLLSVLLLLPFLAPALVYWHAAHPRQAILSSVLACLRNWRALMLLALFEKALLVAFALLGTLVLPSPASEFATILVVNVFMLLPTAVINIAWLFAFRDIFAPETAQPAAAGVARTATTPEQPLESQRS